MIFNLKYLLATCLLATSTTAVLREENVQVINTAYREFGLDRREFVVSAITTEEKAERIRDAIPESRRHFALFSQIQSGRFNPDKKRAFERFLGTEQDIGQWLHGQFNSEMAARLDTLLEDAPAGPAGAEPAADVIDRAYVAFGLDQGSPERTRVQKAQRIRDAITDLRLLTFSKIQHTDINHALEQFLGATGITSDSAMFREQMEATLDRLLADLPVEDKTADPPENEPVDPVPRVDEPAGPTAVETGAAVRLQRLMAGSGGKPDEPKVGKKKSNDSDAEGGKPKKSQDSAKKSEDSAKKSEDSDESSSAHGYSAFIGTILAVAVMLM